MTNPTNNLIAEIDFLNKLSAAGLRVKNADTTLPPRIELILGRDEYLFLMRKLSEVGGRDTTQAMELFALFIHELKLAGAK